MARHRQMMAEQMDQQGEGFATSPRATALLGEDAMELVIIVYIALLTGATI